MSKIISIEGNIGSGKSTLLRELNTYFKDNNELETHLLNFGIHEGRTYK